MKLTAKAYVAKSLVTPLFGLLVANPNLFEKTCEEEKKLADQIKLSCASIGAVSYTRSGDSSWTLQPQYAAQFILGYFPMAFGSELPKELSFLLEIRKDISEIMKLPLLVEAGIEDTESQERIFSYICKVIG